MYEDGMHKDGMHEDKTKNTDTHEGDISHLFKSTLMKSEESYHENGSEDESVAQVLKRVNHQTGARDLLILLMAGSFTFLVALMAPFCVNKSIDENEDRKA